MRRRALHDRLAACGQPHVARAIETLPPEPRANLLAQLDSIDLDRVDALRRGEGRAPAPPDHPLPLPYVAAQERSLPGRHAQRGREELSRGRVAFALLAGGQASRLRWEGPKGTYPIGPRSDRSLFQVLAEQVRRAGRDHGTFPPLAVTTSPGTDAAIRRFFERNGHFGIGRERLFFACQQELPALDDEGRLIFERPDRLFMSPDGHGGALSALASARVLDGWADRGITTVCTFQVDNPLLHVVDADLFGRLLLSPSPIATKIVLKREPGERVGVIVESGGRPALVEYSELPEDLARLRDPSGALAYRLGSIAMHAFRLDFLRRELQREELPIHRARRDVEGIDAEGARGRRPAWKFERFLFDLFPRAPSVEVVEVVREREYAPLKNLDGPDSPETVRAALDAEYRRWHREAGRPVPAEGMLELSPLHAMGPDDLRTA